MTAQGIETVQIGCEAHCMIAAGNRDCANRKKNTITDKFIKFMGNRTVSSSDGKTAIKETIRY